MMLLNLIALSCLLVLLGLLHQMTPFLRREAVDQGLDQGQGQDHYQGLGEVVPGVASLKYTSNLLNK